MVLVMMTKGWVYRGFYGTPSLGQFLGQFWSVWGALWGSFLFKKLPRNSGFQLLCVTKAAVDPNERWKEEEEEEEEEV